MSRPAPSAPADQDAALHQRVVDVLQQYWGYDTLRPLQLDAIRAGVSHRDSLVVLPTGGGKSLCYQLPPLLTGRLSVVVSPLISLMKDQVDGLKLAKYPAAAMYSGMSADEISAVRREALAGNLKLLLVAPERLLTDSFMTFMRSANVGSFAIDEAHCISQWGHDFRPEYRRLAELREHFPELAIHAYTATATPRVRQDIVQQLSLRDPEVLVGIFDRPNLTYRILPRVNLDDQVEEVLRRHEAGNQAGGRAAIVYCISRKDTERLAAEMTARGIAAEAYHAGLDARKRHRVQDDFANERLNVVVATVAFGMGIDRSDVRCVIHASMPKTVEHYQQETGRSGRDGLPSECVLFYSAADVMRWKQLMERSASEAEVPPEPEAMQAQLELLNHMQRLASGARCRHRSLSEYFGQAYPNPNCGACDLCLNELSMVSDAATVAKKIISCVARLHNASGIGFGAAYVADVLRGAGLEKIRQRGHDQLSTFGLLRNLERDRIVSYINQLVDSGALARASGEFPVLVTCAGSSAVLKDQHPVALFDPVSSVAPPKRRAGDTVAAGDLSSDEKALFEALRALRRAVAEQLAIPPYLVFGDATLEEMARVRPGSLESMAHIRGVGNAKLAEFGEQFVRNIVQYCREQKLELDTATGSRPRRKLAAQAGRTSMSAQKSAAFAMFARGASIEEVSSQTQRAISTTHEYLAEWIAQTRPASVSPWVDDRTYAMIVDAAAKLNAFRYRPIFDHFGGSVSYDQIRVVIAHKQALG
jgi:ATP-dependent DNA helicase RecQ